MSGQINKHIDYVNSVVRTDGLGGMLASENRVWQSWLRCARDCGLDPVGRHEVEVIDHVALNARQERCSELVSTAKVEMTNLYQQLAGSGFAVLLTDADGVILNCVGDPDFTSKATRTGILPALRERGDKRSLIRQILAAETADCKPMEIDEDALRLLEHYYWPGNIRQLRNSLRTAMALREGDAITVRDLPVEITRPYGSPSTPPAQDRPINGSTLNSLESAERNALVQGLERHRWKITNLARELSVSRNTLYRKMKRLNIKDPGK